MLPTHRTAGQVLSSDTTLSLWKIWCDPGSVEMSNWNRCLAPTGRQRGQTGISRGLSTQRARSGGGRCIARFVAIFVTAAEDLPVEACCKGAGRVGVRPLRLAGPSAVGAVGPPCVADRHGYKIHAVYRQIYGVRRVHAEVTLGGRSSTARAGHATRRPPRAVGTRPRLAERDEPAAAEDLVDRLRPRRAGPAVSHRHRRAPYP